MFRVKHRIGNAPQAAPSIPRFAAARGEVGERADAFVFCAALG